jgi:hypothetical protein
MKFSTREDIAAPQDHVFAEASDFAAFERRALREGASVTRLDHGSLGQGTAWEIGLKIKGRARRMTCRITGFDAPDGYVITSETDGLDIVTTVDLVALSRSRTRVMVGITVTARNLPARILLQSLKLGKGRLDARFKARIHGYATAIADSYRTKG